MQRGLALSEALPHREQQGFNAQHDSAAEIVAAIKRCSKRRDLECGKRLHREAAAANLHTDRYVGASLIAMYSKCGSMALAKQAFDEMRRRDVVAWNALILGYAENGESSAAMDLFTGMDCKPSSFTYVAALKACAGLGRASEGAAKQSCLEKGIAIHRQIKDRGFDSHMVVGNALADMYSKCCSIDRAREVFDRMVSKDVATWNTMILGYVQNGQSLVAMDLFSCMDCEANCRTYVAAFSACGSIASESESEKQSCLDKGVALHRQAEARGFVSDKFVANSLLDMYNKCGSMELARKVFDGMIRKDVFSWTSLIQGYAESGERSVALDLFAAMDCKPNCVTYWAVLKACETSARKSETHKRISLEEGMAIHKQVRDRGFESDMMVAKTLVDMYSNCGSMQHAKEVFDRTASKTVFTWNSLILGYLENLESLVALDLFTRMDCEADAVTYVAALKACRSLAALPAGREIHAKACRLGLEQEQTVANSLIDLYGKCGSMNSAEFLFNGMQSPDVVSWTALMAGYSTSGDSCQVFSLAKRMKEVGLQMPDTVFSCILMACCNEGLVEEARLYFESMSGHGISPKVEHCTYMIGVLCRANRFHEALDFVKSVPLEPKTVLWKSLLASCSAWRNLEVGQAAFNALVAAGTADAAAYVFMSNIYGSLPLSKHSELIQCASTD